MIVFDCQEAVDGESRDPKLWMKNSDWCGLTTHCVRVFNRLVVGSSSTLVLHTAAAAKCDCVRLVPVAPQQTDFVEVLKKIVVVFGG